MTKTSTQSGQPAEPAERTATSLEPTRRFSIARLATGGRPLVTISPKAS